MINYNWRSQQLLFFKSKIKSQSGFYLNSCESLTTTDTVFVHIRVT
jgi:hypothetical protein